MIRPLRRAGAALAALAVLCGLGVAKPATASSQAASPEASGGAAFSQDRADAIEQLFRQGLAALERGDAGGAIRAFRAALALDPRPVRIRLELARALFVAREWDEARREFFAVLSGGLPDTARRNVLAFIRAIDARRGWDWSLSASIEPDLGGRRYVTDTVDLDFLGSTLPFTLNRADPPPFVVKVASGVEVRAPLPSVGDVSLLTFAGGFAFLEEAPGSRDDDYTLGVRGGLRAAWPRTTLSAGPRLSRRWVGGALREERLGGEASGERRFDQGRSVFARAEAAALRDPDFSARDGAIWSLRTGGAFSIGGRTTLGAAARLERLSADRDSESYWEPRLEVFGGGDVGGGYRVEATVFHLVRRQDDPAPFFFVARVERETGLDIRISREDVFLFERFTPFVTFGASRRRSNISAFGYDETRLGVGLARAF